MFYSITENQDPRSFFKLLVDCEVSIIANRVISAALDFFLVVVGNSLYGYGSLRNKAIQVLKPVSFQQQFAKQFANILLEVPVNRQKAFMQDVLDLFEKQFLKSKPSINLNDESPLKENIQKIAESLFPEQSSIKIVKILASLQDKRREVITCAKLILNNKPVFEIEQLLILIGNIAYIPDDQRTHVIDTTLKLSSPCALISDKIEIIEALSKITSIEKRDDVASRIQEFIQFWQKNEGFSQNCLKPFKKLIRILAAISPSERAVVTKQTISFMTPYMHSCFLTAILYNLAILKKDERDLVVDFIHKKVTSALIRQPIEPGLIPVIAAIPPSQREEVIHHTQLLIDSSMNSEDRVKMIGVFQKIPQEEMGSIVACAKEIIVPKMNFESRKIIVETIAKIQASERENVIQNAKKFIAPWMGLDSRIKMIQSFADAAEERDVIANLAAKIIDLENMNTDVIEKVIRVIADAPVLERVNIIENATLLITRSMKIDAKVEVIEELKKIVNSKERDDITVFILDYIGYEEGDHLSHVTSKDLKNLMKNLSMVPAVKREDILANAPDKTAYKSRHERWSYFHGQLGTYLLETGKIKKDRQGSSIYIEKIASFLPERLQEAFRALFAQPSF